MCVEWVGDWEVAAQDIVAYKVVEKSEDGKYRSPLRPDQRATQSPTGSTGTVLEYVSGAELVSDHPGIYLTADQYSVNEPQTVIKVTIPKGSMLRRGKVTWYDADERPMEVRTINALRVLVGDECEAAHAVQPWYTTTAGTCTWGYVTASTTTTATTAWYTTAD